MYIYEIYCFCMEKICEHVSVHWHLGNYQLWANCFMFWKPAVIAGLWVSRQLRHPLLCRVSKPLGHDPSVNNGLALAIWYHTPGKTMSRLWAGTILHCTAYTWHRRIDISFVWRKHENMYPRTGIRVVTSYEGMASCAGTQRRRYNPEITNNP